MVETESWAEKSDGSISISQTIIVERSSHKPIVIGKQGSNIKKIGESARKELETIFKVRVHLFLFVKVRSNWENDKTYFSEWGLDFNA